MDNEYIIDSLIEKLGSSSDLEAFLRNKISENIEKGYPANSVLESKLETHLESIIRNNNDKTII